MQLAWLPIPLFFLAIVLVRALGTEATWDPGAFLFGVRVFFVLPAAVIIAVLTTRSFLENGEIAPLMLGCGALFWGGGSTLAPVLSGYGDNVQVTVHNISMWAAALCHVGGAVARKRLPRRLRWSSGAVAGVCFGLAVIAAAAAGGKIPPFFEQGAGGTPLRQATLVTAIAMFAFAAWRLVRFHADKNVPFLYWYGLGLGLLAVGLTGVMLEHFHGGLLSWTGRIGQLAGGLYMLVAALLCAQASGCWRLSLASALSEARRQYETLFNLTGDGMLIHEAGNDLSRCCFVRANPAVCSMLGYTEAEMRTLAPPDIVVPDEHDRFASDLETVERDGVLRHEKTLLTKAGERICAEIVTRPFEQDGRRMVLSSVRDVTARKRAQTALQESEKKFRFVAMNVPDTLFFQDRNLRYVWIFNPADPVAESDVIGKTDTDLLPRDEAERLTAIKQTVLKTEKGLRKEMQLSPGGSRRWYEAVYEPSRDEDGQVVGIVSYNRDITGRKRVEEALRRSEQIFRRLAEANLVGVGCGDSKGNVTYVNDEMLRMMGYTRADFEAGKVNWAESLAPECRYDIESWNERLLQAGRHVGYERTFLRPDGGRTPYLGAAALIEPGEDFHVSIALDLTRTRAAEAALRESEERFRTMANGSPLMIWVHDADGNIEFVNQAYLDFFGVTPEMMQGRQWQPLVHPEDAPEYKKAFFGALRARRAFQIQARVKRYDGEWRWVMSYGSPRFSPSGEFLGIVGSSPDITDWKRTEDALAAVNENLEERVEEQTAEVSELATQLRALASQLSQTEQRERKRLARILHDHIQQLLVGARLQLQWQKDDPDSDGARNVFHVVDEILDEALEASRNLTLDLSPPVLHEGGLVGGLHWLKRRMREKHGLTVALDVDRRAEPDTEETRFLLFECIRELLFNVLKHSGVYDARVRLRRLPGDRIDITVVDEGAGFDDDLMKNRRAENETFGLFSIQERLAYIGGETRIRTERGRGTTVSLSVPVGEAKATVQEVVATKDGGDFAAMRTSDREKKHCRVLIVDDHKIMREGLARLLAGEADIEVVGEAADGPSAIELAAKLHPDVVIMDVNLGAMSGVEATRRIRAANPCIQVVGLSMHTDDSIITAMREAGAAAYLTKGGASEKLVAAIRTRHAR